MAMIRFSFFWQSLSPADRVEVLALVTQCLNTDSPRTPFGFLRGAWDVREHLLAKFGALFEIPENVSDDDHRAVLATFGVDLRQCLVLCREPQFLPAVATEKPSLSN